MNIWFTGTGQFAALCLDALTRKLTPSPFHGPLPLLRGREKHCRPCQGEVSEGRRGFQTITRIITGQPTRSGRNNKENPSPVEIMAANLGLDVMRTGKLSENQELISALDSENPDVIFVIDFGQLIREPFLSRMCLNIHPSLLPEYRGAAPIQRALLDGHDRTGVTVFRLAKAMDAGEILRQSEIKIEPSENASDLYERLSKIGCEIASEALENEMKFTKQDESLATIAPKLEKQEFLLTVESSAQKFVNTVRALDMSGGAYMTIDGKRLKVWRARLREDVRSENPGEIIFDDGKPVIMCVDSGVELLEVQSEGKRRMSGREWSAGLRGKVWKV